MPESMCKYCGFRFAFAPARLTALFLFSYSEQGLNRLSHSEEGFHIEQESRSFDGPHFLVYGIQNRDPDREGYAHQWFGVYLIHT